MVGIPGTLLGSPQGTGSISGPVPGASLWLDATNLVGTGISPGNNTAVGSWHDLSGFGTSFSQGVGANQPIYKTNILNGNSVVRFNGTSSYMQSAQAALIGPTMTVFIVGTTNGNAGTGRGTFFDYSSGISTNTGCNILQIGASDGGPEIGIGYYDSSLHEVFSTTITLPYTAILSTYNDGANAYLSSNGTQIATEAMGNLGTPNHAYYTIGSLLNGVSGWWLNGDIGELLVYPGALPAVLQLANLNYLSVKWGISI